MTRSRIARLSRNAPAYRRALRGYHFAPRGQRRRGWERLREFVREELERANASRREEVLQ